MLSQLDFISFLFSPTPTLNSYLDGPALALRASLGSGECSALPAKVLFVDHHLVRVKALATLAALDLKKKGDG